MNAKKSKFADTLAEAEKEYGDGIISRGAGSGAVEAISTGVLSVDLALGCGGFPRGRICEVFGPPSSGKTSLLLKVMGQAQAQGLEVAFVDAECSFLVSWAKEHGVNTDEMIFVQPEFGEQALNITEKLVIAGVPLVVVDSVEGLVPRAEVDGEMEDAQMGVKARMVGKGIRKLQRPVAKSNSCLLLINQVRSKVGVVYGNPEVTTGGKSIEFAASIRVRVSRKEIIKEGDNKVGIRTQIETVKNKVSAAFKKAEFDVYGGACSCHGKGIDVYADLLDVGVERGVIEKSGSWFAFNGERIGQGRLASCERMKSDAALAEAVKFAILKINHKGETP